MPAGDVHNDTFTRTVAAGGLGTSDDGHTYSVATASNFSVDGARAVVGLVSAGSIQTATVVGVDWGNVDLYAEIDWSAVPVGAQTQSYLLAAYTDGSNHYRMQIALSTAGNLTIKITRSVAGVATDVWTSVSVGSGYTAGTVYKFRFRITDWDTAPILQGKGWLGSNSEPATWTLNDAGAVDATPWIPTGDPDSLRFGFRHQQNAGGTNFPSMRVALFQATDLDPAPPGDTTDGDLLHDDFERTVAAGDWGTAPDGHTWTETTAANFSVNGGAGRIALPSAGSLQTAVSNATAKTDAEVIADISLAAVPVGAPTQSYLFLRYVDGSNHYKLKIQGTTGGHLTLNVTRVVAGTAVDVYTTVTAVVLTPDIVYRVRFRVTGGATPSLQAKLWDAETTEPTTWTLNDAGVADASPITTAGTYAVRHQQNAGGTNLPTLSVWAIDVFDLTGVPGGGGGTPPSSGAARLTFFADNAGNVARVGFVRAAAVARLGATPFVPINGGDNQYDGGWYREIMQTNGFDAAMGALNATMRSVEGNHDKGNPVGGPSLTSSSPLAKWVANTPASSWNNADKLCVPTTAAKANGFYYKASATGTTGSSEPNWATAAVPGATISDGTVTWTCCWPGQDWRDYVNQRKVGGVYAAYTLSKEPLAAGGGYTRPSGSAEMTAMGALYGTKYSTFQSGSDPLNPHNEYSVELVTGTDGGGSYQWLICYANTELEYGKRPGDTHTASGYGPASATISGAVTPASLQYQYFQRELAKYPGIPKVLVIHWPPIHTGGEWPRVQAFCGLMIQNGCRIILAGHHHNYQRFVPMDSTLAETSHAGNVLPAESCVLAIVGDGGIDINGLGTVNLAMLDVRGTTGTMAGAETASASANWYGFLDCQLDRGGFTLTHVVGANSSGTQITYPAASNGSIHDLAAYTFTSTPAPATPTVSASPNTTPSSVQNRTMTFSSATGGVTYDMEFNGVVTTGVTSPQIVSSALGGNSFRVRAVLGGVASPWSVPASPGTAWTYQPAVTTTNTYTPNAGGADNGYRIRALVIGTNANGSSQATPSAWSEPVTAGPEATTLPEITGSPYSGNQLVVSDGEYLTTLTGAAYQWMIATSAAGPFSDVAGETADTFLTDSADVTKYLQAEVTVTDANGTTVYLSNIFGPIVNGAPIPIGPPAVNGVGPFTAGLDVLTTTEGTWDGTQPITLATTWESSDNAVNGFLPIAGAVGTTYAPDADQASRYIRPATAATNSQGGPVVSYGVPVLMEPPASVPDTPTVTWRWVLTNRDGGPIKDILATDRWLEPMIDGAWSAGFTMPLTDPVAPLIEEGRTRLKIYSAPGVIRFHGKVWDIEENTDSGTITVICWDQLKQAEYDHVSNDNAGNVLYKRADDWTAPTMIRDLVGRANGNALATDGAELRFGTRFGSGYTTKHRKFEPTVTIAEALLSFVGTGDPVEIMPVPVEGDVAMLTWPIRDQTPELVETITVIDVARRFGGDSSAVFGYGKDTVGNLQSLQRQRSFSTIRNRVIMNGGVAGHDRENRKITQYNEDHKGTENDLALLKPELRQSTPQTLQVSRSRLGVMEEFGEYPNIKDVAELNDRAGSFLRGKAKPQIVAVPAVGAPRLWTDFVLGDTVLLVASVGSLQVNQRVRVTRARIEWDDDGNDSLTQITFGVEDE